MNTPKMESVVRFCGECSCGCPELFIDRAEAPERRIVITDDFGQRIHMSVEQLGALTSSVKSGAVDHLV